MDQRSNQHMKDLQDSININTSNSSHNLQCLKLEQELLTISYHIHRKYQIYKLHLSNSLFCHIEVVYIMEYQTLVFENNIVLIWINLCQDQLNNLYSIIHLQRSFWYNQCIFQDSSYSNHQSKMQHNQFQISRCYHKYKLDHQDWQNNILI